MDQESVNQEFMLGIIPAAGAGNRIQPLGFSKELLPVGSRLYKGAEKPKAVSEYLVERLICAGADKLCFVISPTKTDILEYYSSGVWGAQTIFAVQEHPEGLCDAVFRPAPFVSAGETVVIGLPDTVWFPKEALCALPSSGLSLLLFPVEQPDRFDSVVTDEAGAVLEIQVKQPQARSHWIWGAIKMPGEIYHALHRLWRTRQPRDEYLGTLINAWLAAGGSAVGVRAGSRYMDVGTIHGYRAAVEVLDGSESGWTLSGDLTAGEDEEAHASNSLSR